MKYAIMAIEKGGVGETELLLRHEVWLPFATISWASGRTPQLFLHPSNLTELGTSAADGLDVLPKEIIPVFDSEELRVVLATVKAHAKRIQAQRRKPFSYISEVKPVVAVADLVMKAIVTPGDKTDEGRLIEAVTLPWFEIIKALKLDPSVAFQISPRKWEEIIAGAYKIAGFDEVTLTPASGDLGRDVIAVKHGLGIVRVIDQVKAYKPGHLVTANDARALFGVLNTRDGASKGFLTTTSDFAPRLRDDALLAPYIPSRLELINGTELFRRLEEIAHKRR